MDAIWFLHISLKSLILTVSDVFLGMRAVQGFLVHYDLFNLGILVGIVIKSFTFLYQENIIQTIVSIFTG